MRCDLFSQTVTLYRLEGDTVRRTVLRGVHWQRGRRALPENAGTRTGAMMLLVIPAAAGEYGQDYLLDPGDRVCDGEGPALTVSDWPGFVPAADRRVAVVEYVTPFTLGGRVHHVEAGAWWNTSGSGAKGLTR